MIPSKELLSEVLADEIDCCQAIAELEEAQLNRREWYQKGYNEAMKPKTCKGCKGEGKEHYNGCWDCYDFSKYETKDTQC